MRHDIYVPDSYSIPDFRHYCILLLLQREVWSLSLSRGLEEDWLPATSRQAFGCPCPLHSRQWRVLQTSKPIDINFCINSNRKRNVSELGDWLLIFFFLLFLTWYLIGIRIVPVLHEFVHQMARLAFLFTPLHWDDQSSLWCVFWSRTLKLYVEFLLRNWSMKKKKKKSDFSAFLSLHGDVCSDLEP